MMYDIIKYSMWIIIPCVLTTGILLAKVRCTRCDGEGFTNSGHCCGACHGEGKAALIETIL